jgi:hypothetical protein
MITSIELNRIRGIRSGHLKALTPLSVLVGRNGCGKSTLLDALAIAAAADSVHQLHEAVGRRGASDGHLGADWFLTSRSHQPEPSIAIVADGQRRLLAFRLEGDELELHFVPQKEGARALLGSVRGSRQHGGSSTLGPVQAGLGLPAEVRFIDQRANASPTRSPTQAYSDARLSGRKKQVLELVKALIPRAEDLEILTLNDVPTLHVSYANGAVPLSLSGDGVRNAVLLGLELGVPDGSLLLIEEPETHLHFGAMRLVAQALVQAVAPRGAPVNQVVLATHSLEFIDALVGVCAEKGTQELLSVHRLVLNDGVLTTSTFSGDLVANARLEAEYELR